MIKIRQRVNSLFNGALPQTPFTLLSTTQKSKQKKSPRKPSCSCPCHAGEREQRPDRIGTAPFVDISPQGQGARMEGIRIFSSKEQMELKQTAISDTFFGKRKCPKNPRLQERAPTSCIGCA
jgi:hypothetical protein